MREPIRTDWQHCVAAAPCPDGSTNSGFKFASHTGCLDIVESKSKDCPHRSHGTLYAIRKPTFNGKETVNFIMLLPLLNFIEGKERMKVKQNFVHFCGWAFYELKNKNDL